MAKFKQMIIKNFKSHEETVLDLDEGVNVIYGNPQSGKTNLIRAMELLVYNRPVGAKFMPKFLPKCETEVAVIDSEGLKIGIKVMLTKSKKGVKKRESTYYYMEDTITGELWDSTGVGKSVPPEITKALNLSDINIQLQDDPPFMATKSGSKISKTVNKITGLDIGDQLNSELTKRFNTQKAIIGNVTADLKEKYDNLKAFPNMKDLASQAARLEKVSIQISKSEGRIQKLSEIISSLENLGQEIRVPDLDEYFDAIKNILDPGRNAAKNKISQLNKFIGVLEGFDNIPRLPNLSLIFGRVSLINSKISSANKGIKAAKAALEEKATYASLVEQKKQVRNVYIAALKELQKCPTCFQDITEETLKIIEGGLA